MGCQNQEQREQAQHAALSPCFTRVAAALVGNRFYCRTAASVVGVTAWKRVRKMRAVTGSYSEHAFFVWGNRTCLLYPITTTTLPACLLCAVGELDFQIKKAVGDEDSGFLLPFNNHPCLLFRESSLYVPFLNGPSKWGEYL